MIPCLARSDLIEIRQSKSLSHAESILDHIDLGGEYPSPPAIARNGGAGTALGLQLIKAFELKAGGAVFVFPKHVRVFVEDHQMLSAWV